MFETAAQEPGRGTALGLREMKMATQKRSNGKSTAKRKSAAGKRREPEVRDTPKAQVWFCLWWVPFWPTGLREGSAPWLAARGALMGIFGPCGYALGLFQVYWAVLLVLNTTIWDDILKPWCCSLPCAVR